MKLKSENRVEERSYQGKSNTGRNKGEDGEI